MKEIRIPKGNGKYRVIYSPDAKRKEACRAYGQICEKFIRDYHDKDNVKHGFMIGKSPVTNAIQHVGYAETLTFDLKDFFDTVTKEMLSGTGYYEIESIWHNGHPVQGLPSSPAIANLAAAPMDNDIMQLRDGGRFGPLFVYTRYADDLTFSFDLHWVEEMLRKEIPTIVSKHGFVINPDKTKLQKGSAGRRIITGVAVDHKGIYPTRYHKRKLRAATHQSYYKLMSDPEYLQFKESGKLRKAQNSARGLEEWCKLKLPKNYKPHHEQVSEKPGTISVTVTQSTHQHQEFHRSFNL